MSRIALVNSVINTKTQNALAAVGYECVALPRADYLSYPMSTHPDMLVFSGFGKLFTHKKYYEANKELIDSIISRSSLSLVISDEAIDAKYPNDVLFNCALVGNKLICNKKYVSKHILCEALKHNITVISVKQGYVKCSVCVVDNSSVITSDVGIYNSATAHGIDCLLISSGSISLPPYEYGFIGGSSGNDDKNVYFCGDINKHPDGDRICKFITSKNKNTVCLDENMLFDFGSILFL